MSQYPQSQSFLESVLANSYTAILGVDASGTILYSNTEARRTLGYSEEELYGISFLELVLPEFRSNIEVQFRSIPGEQAFSEKDTIVNMVRKDRSNFQAQVRIPGMKRERFIAGLIEFTDLSDIRHILAKLKESDQRYRDLFESMRSGVAVYTILENEQFIFQDLNRSAEEMLQIRREDVVGKEVREIFTSVTEIGLFDIFREVARTGEPGRLPVTNYDDDRISFWVENYVYKISSNRIVAVFDDLTEHKKAEADILLTSSVFRFSREAIVITDEKEKVLRVNDSFSRITGYSESEVIGFKPSEILKSNRHDKIFYDQMWESINSNGHWMGEIWNRKKNGELFPAWQNISAGLNNEGKIQFYISIFTDISDRKISEERISHLARFDLLTDLPNRVQFQDILHHALEKAKRRESPLSVLSLDLDRFKSINDSLGHRAGDDLLLKAKERITKRIRTSDTVARVGGDEFHILLEDFNSIDDPAILARDLNERFAEPFLIDGREIFIGCSIGISFYPTDGTTEDELIRNADMAMTLSKKRGSNSYHLFSMDLAHSVHERFEIESGIKNALRNNDFRIAYQPQISLIDNSVSGVEALLRWTHPELGQISPDHFISIAEDAGQIIEIGEWVLRETCRNAVKWNREFGSFRVGVNLSAIQLLHPGIVSQVKRTLAETGLDPFHLELEITESFVLNDMELGVRHLEELRKLGVRIALDDFGTGYSSLSYLKNLPVDRLKIDKGFVSEITEERGSMAIALSILLMAKNLELGVIAEGAETKEQVQMLRENGCDEIQGYYFSRPLEDEAALREIILHPPWNQS